MPDVFDAIGKEIEEVATFDSSPSDMVELEDTILQSDECLPSSSKQIKFAS